MVERCKTCLFMQNSGFVSQPVRYSLIVLMDLKIEQIERKIEKCFKRLKSFRPKFSKLVIG